MRAAPSGKLDLALVLSNVARHFPYVHGGSKLEVETCVGKHPQAVKLMPDSEDPTAIPELEELSFEAAFKHLSEMVEALEKGGLPLQQATDLYERGMSLVQRCNGLLNAAELKITQLKDTYATPAQTLDWDDEPDP